MHRIEHCQIKLLDKPTASGFPWLADLGTVHGLRFKQRLYGQFGATCTFSLESGDPWAAELSDGPIHFLWVLRDGQTVFSGFQVVQELGEDQSTGEPLYDFEFLPLPMWLHHRAGVPLAGGAELEVNAKVDDAFKWIVERVLGPTAPASPTNAVARAWPCLVVAANKTEHPDNVEFNATRHTDIYEWLQRRAVNYDVDWDIYFKLDGANIVPEFETWYPRRGADRSEDNGVNAEVIFSDAMGDIRQQQWSETTADMGTIFYTGDLGTEIVADAGEITNWLARDHVVPTGTAGTVLEMGRADNGRKASYKLGQYRETLGYQWMSEFIVGDKVTYGSVRMDYGPVSDIICGVDVEFGDLGYEELDLLFGDPKPDIMDKLRGGTGGATDPDYTMMVGKVRYLYGDTPTNVRPDNRGRIGVLGGARISVVEDAGAHTLTISSTDAYGVPTFVGGANAEGAGNAIVREDHVHKFALQVAAIGEAIPTSGVITLQSGGATIELTRPDANTVNLEAAMGGACLWLDDPTYGFYYTRYADEAYDRDVILGHHPAARGAYDQLEVKDPKADAGVRVIAAGGTYGMRFGQLTADATGLVWNHDGTSIRFGAGNGYSAATEWFHINGGGAANSCTMGADLRVYSDLLTTLEFEVDGATGDTWWGAGATWTIEGHEYTLPTAFPATTGLALVGTDAGVLTWAAPAPAAHVVNSTGPHAESGLTIGHVLRVSGAAAFAFAELQHSDLGGVGAADHHAVVTLHATLAANLLGLGTQELTLDTQTANLVFAGPAAGGAVAPTFRSLVAADIPDISAVYVPVGRTITAGAGLTGGGDLSANRTFDVVGGTGITANADDVAITNTAVVAAAYGDATHVGAFTVNAQGQLTAAADVAVQCAAIVQAAEPALTWVGQIWVDI